MKNDNTGSHLSLHIPIVDYLVIHDSYGVLLMALNTDSGLVAP